MKRFISAILVLACLVAFAISASAETSDELRGTRTIQVPDGKSTLSLSISEAKFNEEHTIYTVTVYGFNAVKSGRAPAFADIRPYMPFDIAVAWSPYEYIGYNSFTVTTKPVTIAHFEKKSGSWMEQPLYIMIAPKGTAVNKGWYYVISQRRFYPAEAVLSGQVTGESVPEETPEPTAYQPLETPQSPPAKPTVVPSQGTDGTRPAEKNLWAKLMTERISLLPRETAAVLSRNSGDGEYTLLRKAMLQDYLTQASDEADPFEADDNRTGSAGRNGRWFISMFLSADGKEAMYIVYHHMSGDAGYVILDVDSPEQAEMQMKEICKNEYYPGS